MISIEERVANALADLEGLLADGVEVNHAITEAAHTYCLKPENLTVRAAKALGDLEEVRAKFARLRESRERDTALRKKVADYVDRFLSDHPKAQLAFIPINRWIKQEFVSDQLARDIAFAEARMRIARQKKLLERAESQRLEIMRESNA